jgi:hypothetical protein
LKIKKAINTAEKDKEGDHREIPVLFDDQDKDKRDKSRNIFFYGIPKYWKDDDIFREFSKIGKVFSIKVKQYKYKSVRANIFLNDTFELQFKIILSV